MGTFFVCRSRQKLPQKTTQFICPVEKAWIRIGCLRIIPIILRVSQGFVNLAVFIVTNRRNFVYLFFLLFSGWIFWWKPLLKVFRSFMRFTHIYGMRSIKQKLCRVPCVYQIYIGTKGFLHFHLLFLPLLRDFRIFLTHKSNRVTNLHKIHYFLKLLRTAKDRRKESVEEFLESHSICGLSHRNDKC